MKKEVKAIVAVVLAVWILVMGIEIGSIREKKAIASANATTSQTTTEPTTMPTTTMPVIESTTQTPTQPSTQLATDPVATEPSTQAPAAADPSTMSKEEIVNKVVEAVNLVKSEQNMTARKRETITISLTDLSIPSAKNTVNDIISSIAGEPSDETITVANGIATYPDGSTRPIKEAIPPSNDVTKDFTLTADGVLEAKAEQQGDSTVYTVILVEESTTAANPRPTHNAVAIGYLDLLSVELPAIVTIVDSNMKYPGSTVEVTVNAEGKVTKLVNKMPMVGDGTAKITLIGEGKAEFEGALDETWEFTY